MNLAGALLGCGLGVLAGLLVMRTVEGWEVRLPLALGWAYVWLGLGGILLAQQGVFSPGTFAGTGGLLLTASLYWRPVHHGTGARGAIGMVLVVLGLLAVAIIGATPVMDLRLEASDPGVYSLAAARLDHTGQLAYEDGLVAGLDQPALDRFFPAGSAQSLSPARSMGFYLEDRESGLVVPQFLPLAFVWMTVARWVLEPALASWAGVGALWLAAVAMFGLVWRTAGWVGATVGSLLLVSNFTALWFARRAAAEPFAIALVLIFACAWLEMHRRQDPRLGLLAGLAFSLAWLCKLELLLLAFPLSILFAHDLLRGQLRRAESKAFWAGVGLGGGLFFVHAWGWSRPYVRDVLLVPGLDLSTVTVIAAGCALLALIAWMLSARWGYPRWSGLPRTIADPVVILVLSGVYAGVLYGLTIRPLTPGWDSDNMLLVAWSLTPTGLGLAVVGLTWLLWRRPGRGVESLVFVLLIVSSLVLWNKQIRPHLLWAFRRLLPVVIPFGIWMIGCAAQFGFSLLRPVAADAGGERPGRRVAAGRFALAAVLAGCLVATGWLGWKEARFYGRIEDFRGTDAVIEQLGAVVPEAAVAFVEPRTRRGLLRFEGALQHELLRSVLRMKTPRLDDPAMKRLLLQQWRQGRRTFLITSGLLEASADLSLLPVEELEWGTVQLGNGDRELPRELEPMTIRARVYEIVASHDQERLEGRLDVGSWDDSYVDDATFYEIERTGERDYRWSGALGRLWLPPVDDEDDFLLLRLASSYPPESGVQEIVVSMNGIELGRIPIRRGWRDYGVALGSAASSEDINTLEFVAEPAFEAPEPDRDVPRTVGVAVDLIRWGPRPR